MDDPKKDPQRSTSTDELMQTLREVGFEFKKLLEQGGQYAQSAAKDAGDWSRRVVSTGDSPKNADVFDQIERLGELRDKGLVTDAEFQAKKTELLEKIV